MSLLAIALLAATPQADPHAGHQMPMAPGQQMPAEKPAANPHAGHDMGAETPAAADPHAGHAMPSDGEAAIPKGTPPPVPADHAADAVWDAATMARARTAMTREHGGGTYSQILVDRLEYRGVRGRDGYAWEADAWFGGDIHRFAITSEGEGEIGGALEDAEVQALYRRAIGPWFNVEAGVRQDFPSGGRRTHAVIGIDGLAPYWFDVSAQAFLSTKGEVQARLEASYDQRITQRLILQPAVEVSLSAQDIPELAVGAGVSQVEAGLRLRYEIRREFAPYIGIHRERRLGDAARFARVEGERASGTSVVAGLRFWF